MMVVDRLSKYTHFIALSHPYSVKSIVAKFVESVIKFHGMPKSIISDRDLPYFCKQILA